MQSGKQLDKYTLGVGEGGLFILHFTLTGALLKVPSEGSEGRERVDDVVGWGVGVARSCDVLHTMAVCSSVLRSCHFPRHLVPPLPPPPPPLSPRWWKKVNVSRFGHLAVELLAEAGLPVGQADISQGPVKLGSGVSAL